MSKRAAAHVAALELELDIQRARAVRAEAKAANEEQQRNALLDTFIAEANAPDDGIRDFKPGIGSSIGQCHANILAGGNSGTKLYFPADETMGVDHPPPRPVLTDIMPGDMVQSARRLCTCELCSADERTCRGKQNIIVVNGVIHAPQGFVGEVATVDPVTHQFWLKGQSRTFACSWDQWRRVV